MTSWVESQRSDLAVPAAHSEAFFGPAHCLVTSPRPEPTTATPFRSTTSIAPSTSQYPSGFGLTFLHEPPRAPFPDDFAPVRS